MTHDASTQQSHYFRHGKPTPRRGKEVSFPAELTAGTQPRAGLIGQTGGLEGFPGGLGSGSLAGKEEPREGHPQTSLQVGRGRRALWGSAFAFSGSCSFLLTGFSGAVPRGHHRAVGPPLKDTPVTTSCAPLIWTQHCGTDVTPSQAFLLEVSHGVSHSTASHFIRQHFQLHGV